METTTIEEIIKHAIQREEDAYHLYRDAAAKATSISARKMFEEMAAEEAGHKELFSRMNFATADEGKFSSLPDMKISEYMADIPLRPDMTYQEILMHAMKAEESACNLYTAAAAMTADPQLKKTLLVLADVEKGHKLRIEAIYDERVLTEM